MNNCYCYIKTDELLCNYIKRTNSGGNYHDDAKSKEENRAKPSD